jgi:hypothetical protein
VVALVIAGAPEVELTVSATLALPVPEELVAVTVNVEVPAAGSVPEIKPVLRFTQRLLGNRAVPKLVGLLVPVI